MIHLEHDYKLKIFIVQKINKILVTYKQQLIAF